MAHSKISSPIQFLSGNTECSTQCGPWDNPKCRLTECRIRFYCRAIDLATNISKLRNCFRISGVTLPLNPTSTLGGLAAFLALVERVSRIDSCHRNFFYSRMNSANHQDVKFLMLTVKSSSTSRHTFYNK